jgi:hypothetical protein
MADRPAACDKEEFVAWSERIERIIVKAIKLLVVLLIVSQLALQVPALRHWLTTTDDAEGIPYRSLVQ